jgi:hypothetical protein
MCTSSTNILPNETTKKKLMQNNELDIKTDAAKHSSEKLYKPRNQHLRLLGISTKWDRKPRNQHLWLAEL